MQIIAQNEVTMSSLEIVRLINDSRGEDQAVLLHKNFLAKVPEVLGADHSAKFLAQYKDSTGRSLPCYRMPKREACLMAMSYSYELQAIVFDRMTELEQQPQFKIPQTLPDALRLAADLSEQLQKQEEQLAIAAPKVEALDRIATADGLLCITSAAKHLQVRPKDLFAMLQERQWIYRRTGGGGWLGYSSKTQQGLLEHKVTVVSRSDGSEKVTEQVLVTGKGMAKLAMMLEGVAA